MYRMPESLLVANPLNRYLLNSTMLSDFIRDADGGITLHIQNESPGIVLETNWLPAPKGPFILTLRLYLPKADALDGTWNEPPVKRKWSYHIHTRANVMKLLITFWSQSLDREDLTFKAEHVTVENFARAKTDSSFRGTFPKPEKLN